LDTGLKIEDEDFLRDCISFFGNVSEDEPWMKSRPESIEKSSKIVDMWLRNKQGCTSWGGIHDFVFNSDEETFQFVLRAMCRKLGNDKFLTKPRKNRRKK
jgi:hypothetical protein